MALQGPALERQHVVIGYPWFALRVPVQARPAAEAGLPGSVLQAPALVQPADEVGLALPGLGLERGIGEVGLLVLALQQGQAPARPPAEL